MTPDLDFIIAKLFAPRGQLLPKQLRASRDFKDSAAYQQTREPNYERLPRDFGDVRTEFLAAGYTKEQLTTVLALMQQAVNYIVVNKSGNKAATQEVEFKYTKPLGFAFGIYAQSGYGRPLPYAFIEPIRERFEMLLREEARRDPSLYELGARRLRLRDKPIEVVLPTTIVDGRPMTIN